MIVRNLESIIGTERDVAWGNGRSRRLLLAHDQVGYSVTDTIVEAGTESHLEYRRHIEACYCIEGVGEVEHQGTVHEIRPGTIYALENNEPHILRAKTAMRLVCVFTPPLQGHERHELAPHKPSAY